MIITTGDISALRRNPDILHRHGRKVPGMSIDIESLSEDQLIELNRRIVARLRMLRDVRAHLDMMDFRIGDRVAFHPSGHPVLEGMVTRYNRKTVTVVTDSGTQWNVSPGLLRKAGRAKPPAGDGSNVVLLQRDPRSR